MKRVLASIAGLTVLGSSLAVNPSAASDAFSGDQLWNQQWEILDGWNRSSSPVIADIDGVAGNEVVFGTQDGFLRAYNGDGTRKWTAAAIPGVAPGCNAQGTASAIDSSPTVADLDKDGIPEVIVGVGSTWAPNQNGSVIAFDGRNGDILWQTDDARDTSNIWTGSRTLDGWCEATYVTPAIGDVDGDGYDDVVYGSWDFMIWAVDRFGEPLPGFPFNNDDTIWSSPALFDIDGDGRQEIFIGGDSSPGGFFDHTGGVVRALDWASNTVIELWNRTPNESVQGSPAIGDINNDGRPELIVTTGEYWHVTCNAGSPDCSPGYATDHSKVLAYHLDDGSTVPGWPVDTGDTITASPALGDLDGDGDLEVVVGSWDDKVYAWRPDGSVLWSTPTTMGHPAIGASDLLGHPIIADLDGDGDQDVAVGSRTGMAMLDGRTGANLEEGLAWQFRIGVAWSFENAPAVGVIDGQKSIVFTGFNTADETTRVAAFGLPSSSATDAWPMFRQNPERTGRTVGSLCSLNGASGTFCDVPDGTWFTDAVEWMVAESITTGVSPTLFGPDFDLTRAQMITFLWRQEGEPTGYPDHGFGDVASSAYYDDAVAWAKAEGITTGTSSTTFSPPAIVTRAQLVTLLWRRAASPGGYPDPEFTDVPAGRYFTAAVAWAKAEGVTNGTSDTTFSPELPVTRAQAAALVWREAGRP
ncbi:MAG: S-layer homology domain-containing protein [Actinomycetota bacterium]